MTAEEKGGSIFYLVRPSAGGIRRHVEQLVSHFSGRYTTFLAAPLEDEGAWDPVSRTCSQVGLPMLRGFSPGRDLRSFWQIYRLLLRARAPALLHMHGFKAALVGAPAAGLARVPAVITIHNFPAHRSGRPLLPPLGRLAGAAQARYIAVSRALAREISAWGVAPGRVTVIHNGIDPAPFAGAARGRHTDGRALKRITVGTVARLAPQKGLEHLVRAASMLIPRFPEMRFEIVGDGPESRALQATSRRLGLGERMKFAGFCADLPARLAGMDIFVMPSLTEGMSISLLEAMAAGCAVVATRVGGIPEVIEDGVSGILVPPADAAALGKAISSLAEKPDLARQLARSGQTRVRERFSLAGMLSATAAVYETVLLHSGCRVPR